MPYKAINELPEGVRNVLPKTRRKSIKKPSIVLMTSMIRRVSVEMTVVEKKQLTKLRGAPSRKLAMRRARTTPGTSE